MTGGVAGSDTREGLLIVVEPCGNGWAVRCAADPTAMIFTSGREAERAAVGLGDSLARSGRSVELHVILRGGALAGRFVFAPWIPPGAAAPGRETPPQSTHRVFGAV